MKLERLSVRVMPGIEPGFTLEGISNGITLITGPNAVGKSSIIRALTYLICDVQKDDPLSLSLEAAFKLEDGGILKVSRLGREIVWELDGSVRERPKLPDPDQIHSYLLTMEDLLRSDYRDQRLLGELRRAIGGGFDLELIRSEMPFRTGERIGRREGALLLEAQKNLREVHARYDSLRNDQSRLPPLEREIDASREAALRTAKIRKALELSGIVEQRLEIEAGLSELPADLEFLSGDESQRLNAICRKRSRLTDDKREISFAKERGNTRLAETGLLDSRPNPAELEARQRDFEAAQRIEKELDSENTRLSAAYERELEAIRGMGGRDSTPSLTPESISKAEELALELNAKEKRKLEIEEELEGRSNRSQTSEIGEYFRAIQALRDWLADTRKPSPILFGALAAGAVGALLSVVFAAIQSAWLALFGAFLALLGTTTAIALRTKGGGLEARARYHDTGLEPVDSWTRDCVLAHISKLETELTKLRQEALRAQEFDELHRSLDRLNLEIGHLNELKIALANEIGFDPSLTAAGIDHFVRRVSEFDRAREERLSASRKINESQAERADILERVLSFAHKWGLPADETEVVDLFLSNLRNRVEIANSAAGEIAESDRELQRVEAALKELDEEEALLFEGAGLERGEVQQLQSRLEILPLWREKQEILNLTKALEAEAGRTLEGEDDLLEQIRAGESGSLQSELVELQSLADNLDSLLEEAATIRTRLKAAGKDLALEKALSVLEQAQEDLEEKYEQVLLCEIGNLLIDDVKAEYRSEHQPEVFKEARERFRTFTHNAFELEFDEDTGFFALDLGQQARRSLDELSTATRMQLLLATRFAWTRSFEVGRESLPIFLDEALTTSDENRFGTIARTLEEFSELEDRQIIYLAARQHEVSLWERATGRRPQHVDLATLRFDEASCKEADLYLPEEKCLEPPGEHTPESYGALLNVPPVDPRQPEGTFHVFYLLRDELETLHRLITAWKIYSLGQLESLLNSDAGSKAIQDPLLRRKILDRCALLRLWVQSWRRGRGKPVDRIALDASGAVSSTFIDRISEVADSLKGNGKELIKVLRERGVARFRSNNVDDLEEWLETQGYIERVQSFTRDDRRRWTLKESTGLNDVDDGIQVIEWIEAAVFKETLELV